MNQDITTHDELMACLGKTPPAIQLKVIDHLDTGAMRWLAAATLAFVGYESTNRPSISLAAGPPGFASVSSARQLTLPLNALDMQPQFQRGDGFGSLFLVPSVGETLRVNGRVDRVDQTHVHIAVEECYVHCAKALIRSKFWDADVADKPVADARTFLSRSTFMAVASMDAQGRVDVSPKGDPEQSLLRLENEFLCYPERPGNRRADSLRNILDQPYISAIAIIPGQSQVLYFGGRATISTALTRREAFMVNARVPKLVTCVEHAQPTVHDSIRLADAGLWPSVPPPPELDPAAIMVGHVKLGRSSDLGGQLMRRLANTHLTRSGLQFDYKKNLY